MTAFLSSNGVALTRMRLQVPAKGVWFADIECPTDDALSGTIVVGDTELVGAITRDGVSNHRREVRVVGGAGGWGRVISALSYHNDANIRAITAINDAATAAGESVQGTPPAVRIGSDYARLTGPASQTLDDIGGDWWVDYAGVTQLDARPNPALDLERVTILEFHPGAEYLDLTAEDLADVPVGGTCTVDNQELTIVSLTVEVSDKGLGIRAWVKTAGVNKDRVAELIGAIVDKHSPKLFGLYGYRVVGMAANRVNLQPLDRSSDLPSLSAVSMWASPGISAELTAGAEVGVMFLDGSKAKPVITAYTPPNVAQHEPVALNLGGEGGAPVARVGDVVNVIFPPNIPFSGTLSGAPIAGIMTPLTATTAVIQGGSLKVFAK